MFSVNNFYDIFNSHYGWPRKNNSIWTFSPHGSKNWLDLGIFGNSAPGCHHGAIIMHDQEPFFVDSFESLRTSIANRVDLSAHHNYATFRVPELQLSDVQNLRPEELLFLYIRSTEVPIFCHSELNSKDIDYLDQTGMVIPCYYWWHGMIARDWFRHWEHHADLTVTNKSAAEYRFLFYSRAVDGTREYRTKVRNALKDYSVLGSASNVSANSSAIIDISDANKTGVHIVAETLYNTEKIYLTEKVFKPMVMSQPFILFAAPGSLQYLRDYGFKTFDSIWDEGYDKIQDHNSRMDATLEVIYQISRLTEPEFKDLYCRALPIIRHNRTYFYSEKFQKLLWKELSTNINIALAKQEKTRQQFPGGTDFYLYNKTVNSKKALEQICIDSIQSAIKNKLVKKDWVLRRYPVLANLL